VGTLKPLPFESHLEVGSAEQCGFQFRLLAPAPMLCEMHFLMSGLSLRLPAPVGIVSGTAASVPLCVKLPAGKLCFLSQVLRGESGAVVSSAPRRRSRPAGRTSWRHLDTRLGYSGFFFAFSLWGLPLICFMTFMWFQSQIYKTKYIKRSLASVLVSFNSPIDDHFKTFMFYLSIVKT